MALYKKKLNIFTGRFDYIFKGNLVSFKPGVATVGDLPAVGNEEGDARITNDDGHLHIWDGSVWQDEGDIIDLKWSSIEGKTAIITLSGVAKNYLFAKDTFYNVLSRFIFKGTTALGTPTKIKVIAHVKTAIKPGDVRIYDLTNAKVIAEVTGINSLASIIVDLGTLSNLPIGEAMFEIQAKSPNSDEIRLSALIIEF